MTASRSLRSWSGATVAVGAIGRAAPTLSSVGVAGSQFGDGNSGARHGQSLAAGDAIGAANRTALDAAGMPIVGVAPSSTAAHQLPVSAGIIDSATVDRLLTHAFP